MLTKSDGEMNIDCGGFLRIFTEAFILFLAPAEGSNPERPNSKPAGHY